MGDQAGTPKILPVSSFMIESVISTLEMAKDGATGVALGIGSKIISTGGLVSETTDSKGGKAATFAAGEVLQTLNLLRLADASPNMVIATVGATFVKKVAAAFMLVGDDNKQAELIGDWADVVGQALALGISLTGVVATDGLTLPLAALNAAALVVACTKALKATNGG
jgi:hypothetical protein